MSQQLLLRCFNSLHIKKSFCGIVPIFMLHSGFGGDFEETYYLGVRPILYMLFA